MRQLLAGLHPGSVHRGESQIDTKLYPEPPKKMPTGLNNEHLTRKPFDYHHPSRNSLVFFGTHFAHIFASSREGGKKDTMCIENLLCDRLVLRTSAYPAPKNSKPLGKLVCIK